MRVLDLEEVESRENDPRDQQNQTGGEQRKAGADRPAVRAVVRVADMQRPEHHQRQDDRQPQHQVEQEHVLVEVVLVNLLLVPLENRDADQVDGVHAQQREQGEDDQQERFEARADRRYVSFPPQAHGC